MAGVLDPYALLGLNEHFANLQAARQAYYALAVETHPDRMAGNADQFKVVHAAWKWVEAQLAGVPDAADVVARFETRREQWAAFLEEQSSMELPALRQLVEDDPEIRQMKLDAEETLQASCAGDWARTVVAPQYRDAWAHRASQPTADAWTAFPKGGYGSAMENSPWVSQPPESFPRRDLVIYEAPAPTPDRLSSRLPSPSGVSEPEDYSVQDANPLGCDYAIGLSDPLPPLPEPFQGKDARLLRTTLEELQAERSAV